MRLNNCKCVYKSNLFDQNFSSKASSKITGINNKIISSTAATANKE